MNREIEFRGKTYSDKWVYGYLLKGSIDDDFYILENLGGTHFWISPETVGQYTGITDKNGKKVYEGDILKVDRELELWGNKTKHETFYGAIEYDEENTRFVTSGETYKNMPLFIRYNISYEVIGNIFEKGGKQ